MSIIVDGRMQAHAFVLPVLDALPAVIRVELAPKVRVVDNTRNTDRVIVGSPETEPIRQSDWGHCGDYRNHNHWDRKRK